MEEALRFFKTYESWIYLPLALVGLFYVRKFILAWDELRGAAFGLERESAQARLNQAASMVVLLLVIAGAVFMVVTFVAPMFPESTPLLTPTLDLLTTSTTTLPVVTQSPGATQLAAVNPPESLPTFGSEEGCIPGQVMITEPATGSEISGVVTIKGSANIPNFGFYKYEVAGPGESAWLTIQAGRDVKLESDLGQWDTRTLPSGDYQFRLVVTDNQGVSLPPCVIQVRVNNPITP